MIYFHANSADLGNCSLMGECLSNMLKTNVILVEYPSYGIYKKSKPSEKKICNDSLFIYDFLIE